MRFIFFTLFMHLIAVSQIRSHQNVSEIKQSSNEQKLGSLEARISDQSQSFVKDIVDRLHALDSDIGKLLYNSTTMYSPDDQALVTQEGANAGGHKFTEVLSDLDSLQDEIGGMISNATRTRQYNILVRLRPLNTILYRIRHNLHLMRNSLVAINTVATLERFGNSVLDSTLQVFLKPDANVTDEFNDNGNYEINLDKPEPSAASSPPVAGVSPPTTQSIRVNSSSISIPSSTTSTSTTTTTTTTTTQSPSSSLPTTERTTRRTTQRSATRRVNRPNQRTRTTSRPTTHKPESAAAAAT